MVDHNIIGYAGTSKKGDMQVFADADHASDPIDRKSIRGYVFTVLGDAVCFSSTVLQWRKLFRLAVLFQVLKAFLQIQQFHFCLEIIKPYYNFL